jgi:hypothetical protein
LRSVVRRAILRDEPGDILFTPYGYHVPSRERSKDIFRPHTEAFACRRCVFFIPWTAGVNVFSGERESGLRDEHVAMRVAHGDAIVAHERRCEYILRAKKAS